MTGNHSVTVQPKEWKQRQAAEDFFPALEIQTGAELTDIGNEIPVREDHALRIAGAAAGKEQGGLLIPALRGQAQESAHHSGRQQLQQHQPAGAGGFHTGQHALHEDGFLLRGPGEGLHLPHDDVRRDEPVDARLLDGALDGFLPRGVIQVHRHLPGEDDGEIRDEPRPPWRQHDADARLLRLLFEVTGKRGGGGEDVRVLRGAAVLAVLDQHGGMLFQPGHDEAADVLPEDGPGGVGFGGGIDERLPHGGDGHVFPRDGGSEAKN